MGYYASAGDWYFGDPGRRSKSAVGGLAFDVGQRIGRMIKKGRVGPMPKRSLARGRGGKLIGPRLPRGRFFSRGRRRMNVLNPRALRKALRRAEGFERFARRVVRITSKGRPRTVKGFRFRRRKKR